MPSMYDLRKSIKFVKMCGERRDNPGPFGQFFPEIKPGETVVRPYIEKIDPETGEILYFAPGQQEAKRFQGLKTRKGPFDPTGINAGQRMHPYTVHKDKDAVKELHFPADPDKDFRNRAKANKKRRIGHEDHKRRTR